jgi:hypothetical protein
MQRVELNRGGVVLVLTLATVVASVYFAKAMFHLDDVATGNNGLSYSDREIAGGNSVIVDQQAAYEARGLIPRAAAYRVRVGSALREKTPLTTTHVESWFRYFLMPRRPSLDARWVICYGCDMSELGRSFVTLWHDESGISIGRLP